MKCYSIHSDVTNLRCRRPLTNQECPRWLLCHWTHEVLPPPFPLDKVQSSRLPPRQPPALAPPPSHLSASNALAPPYSPAAEPLLVRVGRELRNWYRRGLERRWKPAARFCDQHNA
ncbi:hypothetical protein GSI_06548 [Ganoderma sinense ZZ0214-1]|uniref:Uncharacterized protein n=1 Tax=Ganoderma sinense ZZ0214-1 TaxID=1077348 RepID=A0A2G8SDI9_9APHY|nr:hypothetical protein GSI_06548 [Ganoderma sinense ZZ0214-1]